MQLNTSNNSNNTTFGWNGCTHKAITIKACNKINKIYQKNGSPKPFNSLKLEEASILPDIEKNINESHSADIFNRSENDAYDCFRKYEAKSIEDIKNGKFEEIETNIGRALHFLQDMLNPMHVPTHFNESRKGMRIHNDFEDSSMKFQKEVLQNESQNYEPKSDFESSLKKGLEATSKNAKESIQEHKTKIDGLANSYRMTYEFLLKIANTIENINK